MQNTFTYKKEKKIKNFYSNCTFIDTRKDTWQLLSGFSIHFLWKAIYQTAKHAFVRLYV